jgi:hypothetical protein
MFFFKKKNQKTFANLASLYPGKGRSLTAKSFLLAAGRASPSSGKEGLPFRNAYPFLS